MSILNNAFRAAFFTRPDFHILSLMRTWNRPLLRWRTRLLHESGLLFGAFVHLDDTEQRALTVEIIGDEALMTARIEGEYLDRDNLQSSLLRELGLAEDPRRSGSYVQQQSAFYYGEDITDRASKSHRAVSKQGERA